MKKFFVVLSILTVAVGGISAKSFAQVGADRVGNDGGLPLSQLPQETQNLDAFHKVLWAFEHGAPIDPKSVTGVWSGYRIVYPNAAVVHFLGIANGDLGGLFGQMTWVNFADTQEAMSSFFNGPHTPTQFVATQDTLGLTHKSPIKCAGSVVGYGSYSFKIYQNKASDPVTIVGVGAFDNPLPKIDGCMNFPPLELSTSLNKNIKDVFYFSKKVE